MAVLDRQGILNRLLSCSFDRDIDVASALGLLLAFLLINHSGEESDDDEGNTETG